MRKILVGLFRQEMDPNLIYFDNQSCLKLFENQFFHDQSKHIDIRYHHLQYYVQRIIMLLEYTPTEEQNADIFDKGTVNMKIRVS